MLKKIQLILCFLALALGPQTLRAGTVTVSSGTTYQTISGFGAASVWDSITTLRNIAVTLWTDDSSLPPASQVNGQVGLSIDRILIDESGNANWGTEAAAATLALSKNPNMRIFGTSWSPPAKWKNNNNVNGNNTGNDNGNPGSNSNQMNHGNWAAYAAYQTSWATAMKNTYGFTPYALSVQNEPDYDTTYQSCLWSASDFDTYIGTNLGPALNAAGFNPIIMMPESFADNLNLSATTMGDANAAKYVKAIGMHLYGGGPSTVPASYSTTAGHAVESWETEISDFAANDASITSGLKYANQIHNCIVDHNFNAYVFWWILNLNTDNEGLYDNAANPTKRLFAEGNFSKFIRPGFLRIGATEVPNAGVSVSAYYSASTSKVVVVAINSNGSAQSETITYSGLTVATVYPWITDSSRNLVQQASVAVSGGSFTYSLPSQSIVTFVGATGSVAATNTPTRTATPTNTVANTATNTATRTATSTPTKTATPTSTNTQANTATNSPTATPSRTPTATSTNTVGNTATNTPSRTPSNTPTNSSTSTATRTATNSSTPSSTNSATRTPTATSTNTVGNTMTASNTPTLSPTKTPSSTPSNTPSLTSSNTPTNSRTNTPANTATKTPTNSPTATAVNTNTWTPTNTGTAQPTDTATNSPTRTATSTPTNTQPASTNTATNTATNTRTNTSVNTPTNSATRTPSNTPTNTGTAQPTDTATDSPTKTPTATPSNTASRTPSPTLTSTATNSSTRTDTATPSATFTNSASSTATNTPTNTNTSTPTSTGTTAPTNTATNSPTSSATRTPTNTPVATLTPTATSVTVILTNGSSAPGNSTQLPGTNNVPVLQFQLTNMDANPLTITSLTLTASGSGNDGTGISSLGLYWDANGNGIVDGGDVLLATTNYAGNNGTAVFNFSTALPGTVSRSYLVADNFSGIANGSFESSIVNVTDLAGSNSTGAVNFSGAPLNGAVITLSAATATVTKTFTATDTPVNTNTPTFTLSFTPTKTDTPTFTKTPTFTNTATMTSTSSATATFTPTGTPTAPPKGKPTPIIYPNPAPGPTVNILPPPYNGLSEVNVKIFTTAFRKVVERTFSSIPSGTAVTLTLTDRWGTPLASGMYYAVVTTNAGRSTGKLLISR